MAAVGVDEAREPLGVRDRLAAGGGVEELLERDAAGGQRQEPLVGLEPDLAARQGDPRPDVPEAVDERAVQIEDDERYG